MRHLIYLLIASTLVGCATCEPIRIPEYLPPPAACLAPCVYEGPKEIKINDDLLKAYKAHQAQAACLQSRLECVKAAKP
jgi:hypothetical protein